MSRRSELWIIIPNWAKFQHYKDRRPPWIKLYTELRDRDTWRDLSYAQRGLLCSIWLEYAARDTYLRHADIPSNDTARTRRDQLKALEQAGFIQLSASKPLETRARTTELEREKETPLPSFESKAKSAEKPRQAHYAAKANVQPKDPAAAIAAMIRNGVIADAVDLDAELAGYRLEPGAEDELRALFELTAVVASMSGKPA